MPLPRKISPNPLITSTVEIRYISQLSDDVVFSLMCPKFLGVLPTLNQGKIPKELKLIDNKLKYYPQYILKNNEYSLSFSNSVVAFENVGEYTLWDKYFKFIKESLSTFFDLKIALKIERIGIRYVSILPLAATLSDAFISIPDLPMNEYEPKFSQYRATFKIRNYNLLLNLTNEGIYKKNEKPLKGPIIDIDASSRALIDVGNDVFTIIDDLHLEQKKLFFSLLQPDYLTKLNPEY